MHDNAIRWFSSFNSASRSEKFVYNYISSTFDKLKINIFIQSYNVFKK